MEDGPPRTIRQTDIRIALSQVFESLDEIIYLNARQAINPELKTVFGGRRDLAKSRFVSRMEQLIYLVEKKDE